MKPRWQFCFLILTVVTWVLLPARFAFPQDPANVRVIRLSFVEGDVAVQRPDVKEWAEAPINTPLLEGFKLSTGENSFAEMQFQNGDTLRQGQNAIVAITQLQSTGAGGSASRVELLQGYATIHTSRAEGSDVFELVTLHGMVTVRGEALFRVDLDRNLERMEVFNGSVDVTSNLGSWTLASDNVLVLQPGASEPGEVTEGIVEDDWDHWVEDRESRVENSATGPAPSIYTDNHTETVTGWNELLEYGNWSYVPGGGYGWMPTQVGAGWSPYTNGSWCWYSNLGYTWIASEPWGWLPFHYGGWDLVQGMGWMWFPGNLGNWSPAPVDWYGGPGSVGWTPRPHPVVGGPHPCSRGSECGGLAVSADTFRHGGQVNPATGLAVSPTAGQRIGQPQIQPATTAMLPGPAVRPPGAPNRVRPGGGARADAGATAAAPGAGPPRHTSVAPPDTNIVYDPSARSYVNTPRPAPNQPLTVVQPGAPSVTATPITAPLRVQPVPIEDRGLRAQPVETPGSVPMAQPIPVAGGHTSQPAPTTQPSGFGNWGPAAPHSSAPPVAAAPHATGPAPSNSPQHGAWASGNEGGRGGGGAVGGHGGGSPPGAGRH